MIQCPDCGEVLDDYSFCHYCGWVLDLGCGCHHKGVKHEH